MTERGRAVSGRRVVRLLACVALGAVAVTVLPSTATAANPAPTWTWLAQRCDDPTNTQVEATPTGFRASNINGDDFDETFLSEAAWTTPVTTDPSRQIRMYGLSWLVGALALAERTDDAALVERLVAGVADTLVWAPDSGAITDVMWNEGVNGRRQAALNCLYGVTHDPRLVPLIEAVAAANLDMSRYYGLPQHATHNHGLMANLALLDAAELLERPEWQDQALARMDVAISTSFTSVGLGREQSSSYNAFLVELWRRASRQLMTMGSPAAVALALRIDDELVRATAALVRLAQPDGTPVPFGDAQWGQLALDPTVVTTLVDLQAGVLTTRWTWTRTDDFLAVRFGGTRRLHGHEDRLSLVWWAARRPVVVDPGTYSYAPTSTRTWLMSQAAHSVAIVRGHAFLPTQRVKLVQTRMSGPLRRLLMTSTAYGVAQSRAVSVDSVNNSMQVTDAAAGMTLDQVFPLDLRWRLLTQGRTSAVLVDPTGARLMITTTGRITTLVRGADGDDGGWVYAMSPSRRFPAVRIVISGAGRVTTTMRVRGSSLPAPPAPRAPATSPAPTFLP